VTKFKINKLFFFGIAFILLLAGIYIFVALFIGSKATLDTKTKSDVILVLGARSYINNQYNPCLESRMQHAVDLYKAKYAKKILVSGGFDREDNVSEAETMKKLAVEKGIPVTDILLEKNSTSTYENFLYSQKVLKSAHLNSAIIVTEPFHNARAALVAEKVGLNHTVSPTTNSPCWLPNKYFTKYFLKEPFAIMMYKLQNKL
jgi:uncharacterized SAM-binding protein YcdF (DUF218 family)